jgi:pimeloyl-ACP methyl ester carboxylesterase
MHMTRTYSFARFGILVAAGALIAATTAGAARPQETQQSTPSVVLIHGAWADGSSWSKVIPRLEAKGLNVVAVQLPLTSLADDVATVKRAIALEPGPVLLVAHSYGGVVMTEAGNDPKVVGLVYVAAFAPTEGQSAFELANANPTPILQQLALDQSGFLKITPAGVRESFAQDLSAAEQTVLTAAQSPTAAQGSLSSPVSSAAWRNKPSWFVIAAQDRVVSPALQAREAEQMKATAITVQASHVAMLSQPSVVATFIGKAARGQR